MHPFKLNLTPSAVRVPRVTVSLPRQVCIAPPQDFAVGDQVTARYTLNGVWYNATVAEARGDGTYVVDWEEYSPSDRTKSASELRPRLPAQGGDAPPPGYAWCDF